ncbi:hypothetical protein NLI96_g2534 [Meripilus lineatus]|uniref:Uncharacterized protein n=1 Tax=Meripilus lineatus TaxID=2056292 RepID=A0AAD5V9Y1_9APHY|nr:hypothetical protein NLI96_g2534 [Physisporinus lineatus]
MTQSTGTTEPDSRSAKRKLSTSASVQDATKKTKVDERVSEKEQGTTQSPDREKPVNAKPTKSPKKDDAGASDPGTSHNSNHEDNDNDEDEDDSGAIDASKKYKSGPRVFYIWSNGLSSIIPEENDEESCFIVPKAPFDDCYTKVVACKGTKAEKEEIIEDCLCNVNKYTVYNEDEDRETDEAKKLEEIWDVVVQKSEWWFEVTLDSKKPENGKPATRLTVVEYEEDFQYPDGIRAKRGEASRWWITNVAVPDAETLKGIEYLKDYVWDGSDPMD